MQGDIEVLERLFARRVLDLMVRRKRLSVQLRDEMLTFLSLLAPLGGADPPGIRG